MLTASQALEEVVTSYRLPLHLVVTQVTESAQNDRFDIQGQELQLCNFFEEVFLRGNRINDGRKNLIMFKKMQNDLWNFFKAF